MKIESAKVQNPVNWRRLHAFGLPPGSVRALLAILIFATTWALLVFRPTGEVPDYLRDLLFIIMGHYFATRRRTDRGDDPGPPPLYLPRGSVRLVLVAGSMAVAAILYRRGQLTAVDKNPGVITLLLVGGFLLGVSLSSVLAWWRERGHQSHRIVEDLRALISLAAGVLLAALVWNRLFPLLPSERIDAIFGQWIHLGRYGPEHILAAVVGFYFGSKS
jgi:hypothetical protein